MAVALEGLALDILDKGTEFSEEDVLEQLRLAGELGKALLEENQVLRQEANKLEDIVAELEQERENLTRTHLEELNAVRTTCNSENYELQQRLTELQSDETRRNELENEKNKRIFVLEDKVQSLEICIDQLKEERANQYWRGSDMGDNTLEALATWRSTEKELRSQITILTEEQSQHVDNIARLKEELSGMAGYVASLQAEISRSSSVLEQRDKEIVSLSRELEEMHQTLFDLQDEIESGQATVTPPLSSTGESVHEELMRVEEMAVADSFCLSPIAPFESFEQCERCEELKAEVLKLKEDCSNLTQQMHILIKQKFTLSQQIEQWQTDMEVMVNDSVSRQLKAENKGVATPTCVPTTPTAKTWTERIFGAFS